MSEPEKEPPVKIVVVDKISALVTAAFGLVAALAWNDAIKAIFKEIFGTADAVIPMLIYAVVVTIAAVIASILVARQLGLMKKKLN
ncbi:MAG: hypothetical protein HKP26_00445 [Nitrosopumilus sp.]|nr:hypothetical protein [Nitrosopumilus sp.]NNL38009.1 hypothetical protein [Nitrosopumilus sp.]NNM02027.1 hypothetical protein [Nitrosopumilus sp.]